MAAVIRITPAQAESIARRHYGAGGRAQRLASEHDDAFRIVAGDGSSRLLKIGQPEPGAGSAPELPSFQASVLLHLAETAPELPVQRVVTTLDGAPEVLLPASTGPARLARMTSWLDGSLLGRCAATPELRREIGGTLARLNRALRGFSHPGARRTHQWDLQNFGRLDAEGLPANAATTGGYLKDAVTRLASGSPVLGHVRGAGLYLGVDVLDPVSGAASGTLAAAIVNGMRERRVLISATGAAGNVLKVRPPLPFGREHADQFMSALAEVIDGLPG